jgi:site-specific recombinase XerC
MELNGPYLHTLVTCTENTPSRNPAGDHDDREVLLTISALAPAFLEWAHYDARRSPATLERYKEALGWVVRFIGDRQVGELHLGHLPVIRRKIEKRGCQEARMASILNALRSFLKFCRDVLRLPVLAEREVRIPRLPKCDVVYLTKEEVQRFLDAIIAPDEPWDEVPLF